mmetsp:Transcript_16129/g.48486  ORF Transcript_16129/g.48486 Transcript_16129/m.48486 type:complete len:577 (-) Transcript_16129:42-1772(-)
MFRERAPLQRGRVARIGGRAEHVEGARRRRVRGRRPGSAGASESRAGVAIGAALHGPRRQGGGARLCGQGRGGKSGALGDQMADVVVQHDRRPVQREFVGPRGRGRVPPAARPRAAGATKLARPRGPRSGQDRGRRHRVPAAPAAARGPRREAVPPRVARRAAAPDRRGGRPRAAAAAAPPPRGAEDVLEDDSVRRRRARSIDDPAARSESAARPAADQGAAAGPARPREPEPRRPRDIRRRRPLAAQVPREANTRVDLRQGRRRLQRNAEPAQKSTGEPRGARPHGRRDDCGRRRRARVAARRDDQARVRAARRRGHRVRAHAVRGRPADRVHLEPGGLRHGLHVLRNGPDGFFQAPHVGRNLRAGRAVFQRIEEKGRAPVQRGLHGHGRAFGELRERHGRRAAHQRRAGGRRAAHHNLDRRPRARHRQARGGPAPGDARGVAAPGDGREAERHHAREQTLRPRGAAGRRPRLPGRDAAAGDVRVGRHRGRERRRRRRARVGTAAPAPRGQRRARQRHSFESHERLPWQEVDERQRVLLDADEGVRLLCHSSRASRHRHRRGVRATDDCGARGRG